MTGTGRAPTSATADPAAPWRPGWRCRCAGSITLLVAYWADGGPAAQGVGLAVAIGGLALAAGVWGRACRARTASRSNIGTRCRVHRPRARRSGGDAPNWARLGLQRRRGMFGLLGLAGASLLAAMLTPLRSLGPSPFPELRRTGWRAGRRMVDAEGAPVHPERPRRGLAWTTVFPEGDETQV